MISMINHPIIDHTRLTVVSQWVTPRKYSKENLAPGYPLLQICAASLCPSLVTMRPV